MDGIITSPLLMNDCAHKMSLFSNNYHEFTYINAFKKKKKVFVKVSDVLFSSDKEHSHKEINRAIYEIK